MRESEARALNREFEYDTPEALRDAIASATSKRMVREIIARTPIATLVADDHGRYIVVNDAACRLTGYDESQLLTMALPDLTGAVDEHVADRLWRAFVAHGRQQGTFAIRRRDDSTVVVRYDAAANVRPGMHVSCLVMD
jgi:PAS domain S-box-containing protein